MSAAEAEVAFQNASTGKSWASYTIFAAVETNVSKVISGLDGLGGGFVKLDPTSNTYKNAIAPLAPIKTLVDRW